jgi:hypothetical protein
MKQDGYHIVSEAISKKSIYTIAKKILGKTKSTGKKVSNFLKTPTAKAYDNPSILKHGPY